MSADASSEGRPRGRKTRDVGSSSLKPAPDGVDQGQPSGSPPSSLRERQKDARRAAILEAAEVIIRESGSANFAMQELSERAKLSRATPFNLFGSKSAILYTLLNRSLDKIFARGVLDNADPYERVIRRSGGAAELFAGDPIFYRPLYRFVLGVEDPVNRPAFMNRALHFWLEATNGLVEDGILPPSIPQEMFAIQLRNHFAGTLDYWVMGEMTNRQFMAQIYFGTIQDLMAVAPQDKREVLLAKLEAHVAWCADK